MSETKTTRVTAIPCGRTRDGEPIERRYNYELVREPEPFGETDGRARSRMWIDASFVDRGTLHRRTAPGDVVWTDTIEAVTA